MNEGIASLRKFLWHLRTGGPAQARKWLEREAAAAGYRKLETVRGAEGAWVGRGRRKRLRFRPAEPRRRRDAAEPPVNVAVILDDFSLLAFGEEWNCIQFSPRDWEARLSGNPVDLLFVESAWAGNGGRWTGKISGAANDSALSELTSWCRAHGIPSVFWNKEDPPHYDDFIAAAKLFDVVFTSDSGRLDAYRKDLGHDRVDVLSFAAQPRIHNPVRPRYGWHERDVAFAGMYFAGKYPERREQLDLLLSAAVAASPSMETGLEIFARHAGTDPKYRFPEAFEDRVVGSLDYAEMLTAYKAYKTFLNVNSVVDSPTMCSRRVFEVLAAGANIVTTPSKAIGNYFSDDEIFTVSNQAEAEQLLKALARNPALGDRQLHRAQRRIWRDHTYRARSNQVLAAAAPHLARPTRRPSVSALVSTIRPWQLDHVFRTVSDQRDVDVELVLLTHGFDLAPGELDRLRKTHGLAEVTLLSAGADKSLGECLNQCVSAASGDVFTKMDDDDYYGPAYLSDQLHALGFSAADVVGKQAHYMYLEAPNATLLRFPEWEHRYTRTVMGPTIMASADTFRSTPFAALGSGEDSQFLRDAVANGLTVYSSDRFNYCQQRAGSGHTWKVSDSELLASGSLKFFGNYRDEVSV
ncbi:glycosyltransferase family protein [Arthrobacter silvisoli]|uniref:glycosyltransferase family protein n=1 Tax=Arthrobacter silvisoli TaxID=2291022 RepID=UPI000E211309|nr:glycosyltransferase [Arthrobacter silvisoli]